MTFDGRHIHTFYFREKWETTTKAEHERVAHMLREALNGTKTHGVVEYQKEVVDIFMRRLPKVQTSYKMKRGSRFTAVVYKWFDGELTPGPPLFKDRPPSQKRQIGTHFEFAFSTFINRRGNESFNKRGLRQTALKRLEKSPRTLKVLSDDNISRFQRHKILKRRIAQLRKEIGLNHLKTWLDSACVQDANFSDVKKSLDWGKSPAVIDEIG